MNSPTMFAQATPAPFIPPPVEPPPYTPAPFIPPPVEPLLLTCPPQGEARRGRMARAWAHLVQFVVGPFATPRPPRPIPTVLSSGWSDWSEAVGVALAIQQVTVVGRNWPPLAVGVAQAVHRQRVGAVGVTVRPQPTQKVGALADLRAA